MSPLASEETRPDSECKDPAGWALAPTLRLSLWGHERWSASQLQVWIQGHQCMHQCMYWVGPCPEAQGLGGALQRALGECFSGEGTSTPTPGMGVEVAKWNRVWGKSIQGRGSACAKAQRTTWSICRTKDSLMEMQSGGRARWESGLFRHDRVGCECRHTTVLERPTPRAQNHRSASH